MVHKKYTSFKELDKDLKILKLKREIAIWSIKNDYERLQNNLAPKNLALGLINSFTSPQHHLSWLKTVRNVTIGYLLQRILKR